MSYGYNPHSPRDPEQAWALLLEGNARFASGNPQRPNQDVARRDEIKKDRPQGRVFLRAVTRVSPWKCFSTPALETSLLSEQRVR